MPVFLQIAACMLAIDSAGAAKALAASKLAAGGDGWNNVATIHTLSRIEAAGLSGRAESWAELASGRFVDRFTLGPASGAHGFDGTVSWFLDGTGAVRTETTPAARKKSVDESYRRCFGLWFPDRVAAEIVDGGTVEDSDRRFRVIHVTPAGGRTLDVWLEGTTLQLSRVVEPLTDRSQTTYLSDYRRVHGIRFPFATRVSNGDRLFDQKIYVETVEINTAIPPGAFSPPKSGPPPG